MEMWLIILGIITIIVTLVIGIVQIYLLIRNSQNSVHKQTGPQQIFKALEREVREFGKSLITNKEKKEAIEYLELELYPKMHNIEAQIADLEATASGCLRIHSILLILLIFPLLCYNSFLLVAFNAGKMFLSPAFWIVTVIIFIDLVVTFSITYKRLQKHDELNRRLNEALRLYKYIFTEIEPSSIVKAFVKLVAEGYSISPYSIAAQIKKLGIYIDGDDLAIAVIAHMYPTEHEQQEFFARVLKRKAERQIQYRMLPESEKERIFAQAQKEFR
jgi:uncharacterized membrane protein